MKYPICYNLKKNYTSMAKYTDSKFSFKFYHEYV